jgi:hypothetical protein
MVFTALMAAAAASMALMPRCGRAPGAVQERGRGLAGPGLLDRPQVDAQQDVQAVQDPGLDHPGGAVHGLFPRLEQDPQFAAADPGPGQLPGGGQDHGAVGVVAAGVDLDLLPAHQVRQGVHVRAQGHGRAWIGALEHRHHAGAGQAGGHLAAGGPDLLRQPGRGAELLEALLRHGVKDVISSLDT